MTGLEDVVCLEAGSTDYVEGIYLVVIKDYEDENAGNLLRKK